MLRGQNSTGASAGNYQSHNKTAGRQACRLVHTNRLFCLPGAVWAAVRRDRTAAAVYVHNARGRLIDGHQ